MKIRIDRENRIPAYLQISTQIKEMILSGNLASGAILPSERTLAEMVGVHRNTITKAYNELKSEGFISPKQGVSYEVVSEEINTQKQRPKKVNWQAIIKDEFQDMSTTFDDIFERYGEEDIISFGGGVSYPNIYTKEEITKDLGKIIAQTGKKQYFYSPYQGNELLRKRIASFVSTKGIKANMSEIQIMSETNQALDFIATLLVKPGDVVMMEEPISPDAYRTMELVGARIITIPIDEDGMMVQSLENEIIKKEPKLIYVNSSYQDPTGTVLSVERRKKLLQLSEKYRIPIIEDDAASELVYEGKGLPTIKSMDKSGNVIYIYSFSLTFAPGLSLAFVIAPKTLINALSYIVSVRLMAIDWVTQRLIAQYMSDGTYFKKIEEYRAEYARKKELMCERLDELKDLGIAYDKPKGGVYIWVKLPAGIDSKELMENCYRRGLTLIAGYIFYPKKNGGRDRIRLNYSYEEYDKIEEGMRIFSEVLNKMLAHDK